MKPLFFFALVLLSFSTFAQSKENAVWANVEALSRAIFENKDPAALEKLVHSQVTYGHSGGNLEDKPTMVQKAVANATTYKNSSLEKVLVDVQGKTALVRYNFRATSVENGTESPLNLGILQVWKKEKGGWKLWARQAVRIPAKS